MRLPMIEIQNPISSDAIGLECPLTCLTSSKEDRQKRIESLRSVGIEVPTHDIALTQD
jgi:hypothetical protein